MNTDLYADLRAKATRHAESKGLSEEYALGFLNAMWPTFEAAVARLFRLRPTAPLVALGERGQTQYEWYQDGLDIEVEFTAEGRIDTVLVGRSDA